MQYFVYMLRCADNSLYTGITTDVNRRFAEHTADKIKGAKYTRAHKPVKIEAVWETDGKSEATAIEYRIKRLRKAQKESLAANEGDILSLLGINAKRIH